MSMSRVAARLAGLLLSALLAPVAVAAEPAPIEIEMPLRQVSEHVYYVRGAPGIATDNKGFISNAAAVVTDDGIVVVDTLGSPSLAQRFVEELRKVSDAPIKTLIVTHYPRKSS